MKIVACKGGNDLIRRQRAAPSPKGKAKIQPQHPKAFPRGEGEDTVAASQSLPLWGRCHGVSRDG